MQFFTCRHALLLILKWVTESERAKKKKGNPPSSTEIRVCTVAVARSFGLLWEIYSQNNKSRQKWRFRLRIHKITTETDMSLILPLRLNRDRSISRWASRGWAVLVSAESLGFEMIVWDSLWERRIISLSFFFHISPCKAAKGKRGRWSRENRDA